MNTNLNANLGMFDMVLALSASKINFQFTQLYNLGKINRNWLMMCDEDGKNVKTPKPNSDSKEDIMKAEKEFKLFLTGWKNYANDLVAWDKALKQLDKDLNIAARNKDNDKVIQILNQKDEIDSKKTEAGTKYGMYVYAIDAQLDAPKVDILEYSTYQLLFNFYIKSGKLYKYNKGDNKLLEYDLGTAKDAQGTAVATKYAFKVNLSKLELKTADMITTDEHTAGLVEEISDEMFRIESLLLDFQKSNVAQYDENKSLIPTALKSDKTLQVVVTNYFASVGTDKNSPYILGYSVSSKPKATTPTNALFQPTSATYSSSFSQQQRASAFNFLMQTGKKDFPTDGRGKALPESLIELTTDKSETINGTFAIDYSLFKSKYIDAQLIPELFNALSTNIKKSFQQYRVKEEGVRRTDGVTFNLSKENEELNFYFQNLKIKPSEDGRKGIEVSLEWAADASITMFKPVLSYKIEATQKFSSTYGISGNERKIAKNGKIGLMLYIGKGNVVLEPIIDSPILGKVTAMPVISGISEKVQSMEIIEKAILILVIALSQGALFIDDQSMNIGKTLEQEMKDFKALSTSDFTSFSNKIILPGTNVFTFENIRFLTGQLNDQDAVLFDIAYAPEHKA